jgi:aspartyl-tRNA(Asn)/glutamyl-tRNA(Gln) amidotransferase subunit A
MPAGLQLIGRAFREDVILNAAYAFEKTNPMHGAKPNLEKAAH